MVDLRRHAVSAEKSLMRLASAYHDAVESGNRGEARRCWTVFVTELESRLAMLAAASRTESQTAAAPKAVVAPVVAGPTGRVAAFDRAAEAIGSGWLWRGWPSGEHASATGLKMSAAGVEVWVAGRLVALATPDLDLRLAGEMQIGPGPVEGRRGTTGWPANASLGYSAHTDGGWVEFYGAEDQLVAAVNARGDLKVFGDVSEGVALTGGLAGGVVVAGLGVLCVVPRTGQTAFEVGAAGLRTAGQVVERLGTGLVGGLG